MPTSPVKVNKPRGIKGQKKKEKEQVKVVVDEFGAEQQEVERELLKTKIGSFKVFISNMTFEWKDGNNRKLADPARTTALRETMRQGIYRMDLIHRMSGCLDKRFLTTGTIIDPKTNKPCKLDAVRSLNDEAHFPILQLKGNNKVEMQSGQHRVAMLVILRPNVEDQWWVVTIYEDSVA